MNRVILVGRTTKDPTITSTGSTTIARYTLAVDRRFKKDGEQSADFISCVSFGKTAEFIEKYISKGTKVVAEGTIRTGSYDDKEGKKVYTTDVVVESLEFAESKASASAPAKEPQNDYGFVDVPDLDDDSLPFN